MALLSCLWGPQGPPRWYLARKDWGAGKESGPRSRSTTQAQNWDVILLATNSFFFVANNIQHNMRAQLGHGVGPTGECTRTHAHAHTHTHTHTGPLRAHCSRVIRGIHNQPPFLSPVMDSCGGGWTTRSAWSVASRKHSGCQEQKIL